MQNSKNFSRLHLDVEDSLEKIWSLRNAGSFDKAVFRHKELCESLGLSENQDIEETIHFFRNQSLSDTLAIEFLLFEVSRLRYTSQINAAKKTLSIIEDLADRLCLRPNFQLSFQSALLAFVTNAVPQALQKFLEAKGVARTAQERISASFNSILCLEDLGFDFCVPLEEFERDFQSYRDSDWNKSLSHQYEALCIRNAFRTGQVATIENCFKTLTGDQAIYLAAFYSQLPHYMMNDRDPILEKGLRHLSFRSHEGYHSRYEMLTLSGILIQDDLLEGLRSSEQCERFYLWLWRWLLNPTDAAIENLYRVRNQLLSQNFEILSGHEYQFIVNAMQWMNLFLGLPLNLENFFLKKYQRGTGRILSLNYESTLISYLYARRDGLKEQAIKLWDEMSSFALHENPNFMLQRLAKSIHKTAIFIEGFETLQKGIASLLTVQSDSEVGLYINLQTNLIIKRTSAEEKTSIQSYEISRLFLCAKQHPLGININNVLQACFDLPYYDESRHAAKIAKLLYSANRMTAPFVSWHRRRDKIYCQHILGHLELMGDDPHRLSLANAAWKWEPNRENAELPLSTLKHSFKTSMLLKKGDLWLTRRQVEILLNKSKTTASKKIDEWIYSGKLERVGAGRSCRYLLKDEIRDLLLGANLSL